MQEVGIRIRKKSNRVFLCLRQNHSRLLFLLRNANTEADTNKFQRASENIRPERFCHPAKKCRVDIPAKFYGSLKATLRITFYPSFSSRFANSSAAMAAARASRSMLCSSSTSRLRELW